MDIVNLSDVFENYGDDSPTYVAWNNALIDKLGVNLETAASNDLVAIPARDFEVYAKELANDASVSDADFEHWPFNHIDWEEAADELRRDYSPVTVNGTTYWISNYCL